jgi:hypothetical protein
MSNVQNTWFILYYLKTTSADGWKFFGKWHGETALEALNNSKIDKAVAADQIRVFSMTDGTRFERGGWEAQ